MDADQAVGFIGAGFGNTVTGDASSIVSGAGNSNAGLNGFIGAGEFNEVDGYPYDSVIAGGRENVIINSYSIIGGGEHNTIAGQISVIGGGYNNTNNADGGTIAGGVFNRATGKYSSIPGGVAASAPLYGQMAHASGFFSPEPGQAQASEYILRITTTTANETELFLDGDAATQRVLIPTNGTWTFEVQITARDQNGVSAGFKAEGVIKNVNGTTSLNGVAGGQISATSIYHDSPLSAVTVSADDTHDALAIKVSGTEATRWVATVRTTEVKY